MGMWWDATSARLSGFFSKRRRRMAENRLSDQRGFDGFEGSFFFEGKCAVRSSSPKQ